MMLLTFLTLYLTYLVQVITAAHLTIFILGKT